MVSRPNAAITWPQGEWDIDDIYLEAALVYGIVGWLSTLSVHGGLLTES